MNKICLSLVLSAFIMTSICATADVDPKTESKTESKDSPPKRNDVDDILDNMGYPELQVVPRASDRLAIEARSENSGWMFEHWSMELSGAATMFVGFMGNGNLRTGLDSTQTSEAHTINSVTAVVGLGWVIGGALLGADRPYHTGLSTISRYQGKDERSQLMRERMAEEALERPAKIMRVLQYFAVTTNVTMNGLSMIYANNAGRINAGVGLALAFLPLMFQDHSIDIYEKQQDYKKKIYTPIKSASFSYDPYHKTFTPMSNLTWMF